MAANSAIEWTTHTFNPWRGCSRVSEGCRNCYAETLSKRNPAVLGVWGPQGTRVVASEAMWREPLKWDQRASATYERHRVFCASLADVFEDREELIEPRKRLFELIDSTTNLDWLLLTKRPENIPVMVPPWDFHPCLTGDCRHDIQRQCDRTHKGWRPNVWLGTSVENQETADQRIPHLLKCRDLSDVLFLSCEPLLGAVNLRQTHRLTARNESPLPRPIDGIDWVIVGGESGPNARPMHPDWVRSIRDQCVEAGVPFFFKQWGGTNKKATGRVLDGRTWGEIPNNTN